MAGRYPNPRRRQRQKRRPGHKRPKKAVTKKAMIKSRRPLVELKLNSAVNHTYQELADQVTVIVPDSWMVMQQGLEDNNMIGKSLLSRYVNNKFFMSFTQCDSIPHNLNIRVITGWYKTPPNDVPHPETGVPGSTEMGLYSYNPENVIKSAISNMLDNPLGSIDKKIFQVKKDYLMKLPPTETYETTTGSGTTTNYIRAGRLIRQSFAPNKKLQYLPASESVTGAFTHLSPAGAPKQWIPFVCFYFGNFASFPINKRPTYILENHHYFTDS